MEKRTRLSMVISSEVKGALDDILDQLETEIANEEDEKVKQGLFKCLNIILDAQEDNITRDEILERN